MEERSVPFYEAVFFNICLAENFHSKIVYKKIYRKSLWGGNINNVGTIKNENIENSVVEPSVKSETKKNICLVVQAYCSTNLGATNATSRKDVKGVQLTAQCLFYIGLSAILNVSIETRKDDMFAELKMLNAFHFRIGTWPYRQNLIFPFVSNLKWKAFRYFEM